MEYKELEQKLMETAPKTKKALAVALKEIFPDCSCVEQNEPYTVLVTKYGHGMFYVQALKGYSKNICGFDIYSYCRRYRTVRDKNGKYLCTKEAYTSIDADLKRVTRINEKSKEYSGPFMVGYDGKLTCSRSYYELESKLEYRKQCQKALEEVDIPMDVPDLLNELASMAKSCSAKYNPHEFWKRMETINADVKTALVKGYQKYIDRRDESSKAVKDYMEHRKANRVKW